MPSTDSRNAEISGAVTWREFELLVARIEATLQPLGLSVRSPDHVPCSVTGISREVDASIRRLSQNGEEELVTVEARRRNQKQDLIWIEQLATKRRNIGAVETIAVSSIGFSEAAKKLAVHEGITVRTVEELSHDALSWSSLKFASAEKTTFIHEGPTELYFSDGTAEQWITTIDSPLFHVVGGPDLSPRSLTTLAEGQGFVWREGLPSVGEVTEIRWFHINLPEDLVRFDAQAGSKFVRRVRFAYRIRFEVTDMPLINVFRVMSPSNKGFEGIEHAGPDGLTFQLQKDQSTGAWGAHMIVTQQAAIGAR